MNKILPIIIVSLLVVSCGSLADSKSAPGAEVLVFGGTGRLGSDIAKALHEKGYSITIFARPTSNRERLDGYDVSYVVGDVLDGASVLSVLREQQYDVVIDALGRGSSGVEFFKDSAENISTAVKSTGVKQVVLHGSVGAGDSAAAYEENGISASMTNLFAAKTAGEAAVRNSGVEFTIIRNSRLLRYGTKDNGSAALYEDPLLTGAVTRAALARLTVTCVLNKDCYGKTYHAVDKSLNR